MGSESRALIRTDVLREAKKMGIMGEKFKVAEVGAEVHIQSGYREYRSIATKI